MKKVTGDVMGKIMEKLRKNRAVIILYFAFMMIMALIFANKKNLHVDELFSYTLANNTTSMSMYFQEEQTYTPAEQIYLQQFIVNDAEGQFNFANVWKNQTNDVHPPLYYVILHIICSLNVGRFSIWYTAAINICFAMLTLYVLRKLMYLLVNDAVIMNFGSILFVLSAGVLQNVSFLRMYVMAMFWITLTAYLFVKAFGEKFSWKRLTQIGLAAVAGALTHYYCIIYLCATCLVFGICLIVQKRWRDLADIVGYMVVSAGISIGIFPAMLTHMFSGYRGTQSIDNLTQGTWSVYWERIKAYYNFLDTSVLGKIGGAGILFAFLALAILIMRNNNEDTKQHIFSKIGFMKWAIIGVPVVIYLVFVAVSAVYVSDRYIFPIYAVAFCLFFCLMAAVWKRLVGMKYVYVVMCLIGTAFILNGYANEDWEYLYKWSTDLLDKAKTYSAMNCISIYDGVKWKEQPSFYEMKNYKSATFISQEHADNILQYKDLFGNGFILTVIGGNDDRIISTVQNNYAYLNNYEKLGSYGYTTTYRIFAGKESLRVQIHNYDRSSAIGADSFEPGSNVMLSQNEQDTWLIRQDEDHAVVELGTKVLNVAGEQYADGTNVELYPANGTDAQKWKFVGNEDESFTLLSAGDERFALTYGSDGNVYLAEYHEGDASQKWWIE